MYDAGVKARGNSAGKGKRSHEAGTLYLVTRVKSAANSGAWLWKERWELVP